MDQIKLSLDQPPSNYWNRVFIGGNYKYIDKLRKIKSYIKSIGYTPILASDFDIPISQIHDYSLRLLHDCKYAIFEETNPAGELMELERAAKDYDTFVFVIYEMEDLDKIEHQPRLSSMITTLHIPILGYRSIKELEQILSIIFPKIEEDPMAVWLRLTNINSLVLNSLYRFVKLTQDIATSEQANYRMMMNAIQQISDLTTKPFMRAWIMVTTKELNITEELRENKLSDVVSCTNVFGVYDKVIEVRIDSLNFSTNQKLTGFMNYINLINSLTTVLTSTTYFSFEQNTKPWAREKPFAYMLISTIPNEIIKVKNTLLEINEIQKVDVISGPFDILVECTASSLNHFQLVTKKILSIEGILRTSTLIVFS